MYSYIALSIELEDKGFFYLIIYEASFVKNSAEPILSENFVLNKPCWAYF